MLAFRNDESIIIAAFQKEPLDVSVRKNLRHVALRLHQIVRPQHPIKLTLTKLVRVRSVKMGSTRPSFGSLRRNVLHAAVEPRGGGPAFMQRRHGLALSAKKLLISIFRPKCPVKPSQNGFLIRKVCSDPILFK